MLYGPVFTSILKPKSFAIFQSMEVEQRQEMYRPKRDTFFFLYLHFLSLKQQQQQQQQQQLTARLSAKLSHLYIILYISYSCLAGSALHF